MSEESSARRGSSAAPSPMLVPNASAAVLPSSTVGRALKICILARKNLEWNTRIFRQARALSEAGHNVTVVCLRPPHQHLTDRTPDVRYLTVAPSQGTVTRVAKASEAAIGRLFDALVSWQRRGAEPQDVPRYGPGVHARLAVSGAEETGADIPKERPLRANRQPSQRFATKLRDQISPYLSFLQDRDFRLNVERIVSGEIFDCIQAHDSYALIAAGRLRDRCRAKLIFDAVEVSTERSGWAQTKTPRWLNRLEDRTNAGVIGTTDRVLTVSQGLAAWLSEHYGLAELTIVRNCRYYQHIEKNRAIRDDIGLNDGEQLVLYLNSVYEGQGLEQLVDALSYLPKSIHVATLGPLTRAAIVEDLRGRAAALGLEHRFHFLPPKPADEMLFYAAGADIGVVPRQNTSLNNRISLPNRIFELVMARLPIAAPSLPDMKTLVADHNLGLSFDETDPRDIARVIQEMLLPANLERFRQATERAAEILCWENESRHYVESIESLFGKPQWPDTASPLGAGAGMNQESSGTVPLAGMKAPILPTKRQIGHE